jgi:hypothetical protein
MLKTSIALLALAVNSLAFAGGEPYPTAACMYQLPHDARLKTLGDKVSLDLLGDGTLSMKRVPTLSERSALGLWSELRQECFSLGAAHRAAAHRELPAAADRAFTAQQGLLRELREGRFGYAEFNVRSAELRKTAHRRQAQILDSDK